MLCQLSYTPEPLRSELPGAKPIKITALRGSKSIASAKGAIDVDSDPEYNGRARETAYTTQPSGCPLSFFRILTGSVNIVRAISAVRSSE